MQQIFFCHIPKTAGTSLRLALEALYEQHQIVPDVLTMKRHNDAYPPYDLAALTLYRQARSVGLFRGHYPYELCRLLPKAATVVVLREPIARTISNIRHIIRHGGRGKEAVMADLESGFLPVENNLMTRIMGTDVDFFKVGPEARVRGFLDDTISDPGALLSRACANVEAVDFLGLVETIDVLEKSLNKAGIAVTLGSHNTAPKEYFDLTERQMETIRNGNELDIALYRHAAADMFRRHGYEAA